MTDSYAAAASVARKYEDEIMAREGVLAIGVGNGSDHGGDDRPCVVIYAIPEVPRETLPDSLEGLAVYVMRSSGFHLQ